MKVLIIGAGPAAAGAALALADRPEVQVQVLDVGGRLEDVNEVARRRMSRSEPAQWVASDLATVSQIAVATGQSGLPEKRVFGSDFPFRNFGQLDHVRGDGPVNAHVVSGAYGGFSNTWGAQTMGYSAASFDDWPFARGELESDYRAILDAIPYSAEEDDLAEYFPIWGRSDDLPPLGERARRVLDAYERHRLRLRRGGVRVGRARLAMNGAECVSCGLCMTGCPYSLVYSASQTFDDLAARGRIEYRDGYLALRLGEEDGRPFVEARSLATGAVETFVADKVLVACGALGTTRLVVQSQQSWSRRVHLSESVQFLVPFVSLRATRRLSEEGSFTLNQFNVVLPFDEVGHDLVQIHGYPYNKAMDDALPKILRLPALRVVRSALLRRLTAGLGYLPSWWSAGFDVTFTPPEADGQLAGMTLSPTATTDEVGVKMLRAVTRRLMRAAPSLGIAPVFPMVSLSAPGKSYHFGGSFPHASAPRDGIESDLLGRVSPWRHIHLVDASVFPTLPATTFTLSIMANAHRIARGVAADPRG